MYIVHTSKYLIPTYLLHTPRLMPISNANPNTSQVCLYVVASRSSVPKFNQANKIDSSDDVEVESLESRTFHHHF